MGKYRKKPVVIEAVQMTQSQRASNYEWPVWLHKAWQKERGEEGSVHPTIPGTGEGTVSISTLEGEMLVSMGDFIIQGVHGELDPCKPDIFEDTYDVVDD